MRKFVIIICLLIVSQISFAQPEFKANVAKVLRFVERNIDIKNEINKDFRLDFFLYDISLDSKGNIADIHLLILDSIRTLPTINQTATGIKNSFFFGKSNFKKVYIPVMIVYRNNDGDDNNEKYASILHTIEFFESLSKSQHGNAFISRIATISMFEKKK